MATMDMNKTPQIDIIIPFYNQEAIVEKVVQAVLELDYPKENITIIAIDDGSSDETPQLLKKFEEQSRIKLILFKKNRGRAQVRNSGIEQAGGDLIAFLDGDMVVEKMWLSNLLETIQATDVVAAMGESTVPDGWKQNELDKYFYSYWRGARKYGQGKPIPFRRFLFNNTLMKKAVLDETGSFDGSFTGYGGEDTDLAIRLWKRYPLGLRFAPKARVAHHHVRNVDAFCNDMRHFGKTNLPVLFERYPDLKNELGGKWAGSLMGKMFFNPLFRILVKYSSRLLPNTAFTRYLVAESIVSGFRSA